MKIKDRAKPKMPPVEPGVYIAICVGIIDLGEQYSEKFKNFSNKLKIVFELVGETVEVDGETKPRQLSNHSRYHCGAAGCIGGGLLMAWKKINDSILTAIADAIRAKLGLTGRIYPADMPEAISSISGLDTSDATATAGDIALNKTAYVDGEKVTGTVREVKNSLTMSDTSFASFKQSGSDLQMTTTASKSDMLLRAGSFFKMSPALTRFGDVPADKVTEGYRFTSSAGFNKTGTMKPGVAVLRAEGSFTAKALDNDPNVAEGSINFDFAPDFLYIYIDTIENDTKVSTMSFAYSEISYNPAFQVIGAEAQLAEGFMRGVSVLSGNTVLFQLIAWDMALSFRPEFVIGKTFNYVAIKYTE